MADPFIAEIVMFGGNFAPRSWALCDGQLLSIAQNSALFSILGTNYGGDGRTTFSLPDLRGRVPMHAGNGPGLTSRSLGQKGGSQTNTLTTAQLPSHNHTIKCSSGEGDDGDPSGRYLAASGEDFYAEAPNATMAADSTGNTGNNQAVNNLQPYQVVNFIIAIQGVFPSRN